ncbi:hypothetical protein G7K_3043-t1 [Saitoella complicata NRRL Y-17804]|uniref:Uncharacterized protein n=1 Tax=Saitoella complicata (strain BCRC 22490 / CBS 7301 / JCM 7358 / NBRC 10748 / NRRL Y-17804) TaxID=698492 RepID=A0A0E9NGC4_SAICN|nr:hypothetical protein G7K_3043-t1 [Saitoella complicata NRRL Y-17804]
MDSLKTPTRKRKSPTYANENAVLTAAAKISFGTPSTVERRSATFEAKTPMHEAKTPMIRAAFRRSAEVEDASGSPTAPPKEPAPSASRNGRRKSRRQSYLYATKNAQMQREVENDLEQARRDEEDAKLATGDAMGMDGDEEAGLLFLEAPGSVERRKRKSMDRTDDLTAAMRGSPLRFTLPESTSEPEHEADEMQENAETQNQAATRIQTCFRAYLARQELAASQLAANELRQQILAATTIQALWRGCFVRRGLMRQQRAAVTIQKAWRGRTIAVPQAEVSSAPAQAEPSTDILTGFLARWEAKNAEKRAAVSSTMASLGTSSASSIPSSAEVREPSPEAAAGEPLEPLRPKRSGRSRSKIAQPATVFSPVGSKAPVILSADQAPSALLRSTREVAPRSRLPGPGFTGSRRVVVPASVSVSLPSASVSAARPPAQATTPLRKTLTTESVLSSGALRVPSPSPRKVGLGSPSRRVNPVRTVPTAAPPKLALHPPTSLSAATDVPASPRSLKRPVTTSLSGLGSPSRKKVSASSAKKAALSEPEVAAPERSLRKRPATPAAAKASGIPTLSNSTSLPSRRSRLPTPVIAPTASASALASSTSTPARSMVYFTPAEITKATRQNTHQNRLYRCDFERVVVKKDVPRPPSPNAKAQHKMAVEARAKRRKLLEKKGQEGLTMGPGDDEPWPFVRPTPSKKRIRWGPQLDDDEVDNEEKMHSSPRTAKEKGPGKGCIAKEVRLDEMGNPVDAKEPLTPVIGRSGKVVVKKIFDNAKMPSSFLSYMQFLLTHSD